MITETTCGRWGRRLRARKPKKLRTAVLAIPEAKPSSAPSTVAAATPLYLAGAHASGGVHPGCRHLSPTNGGLGHSANHLSFYIERRCCRASRQDGAVRTKIYLRRGRQNVARIIRFIETVAASAYAVHPVSRDTCNGALCVSSTSSVARKHFTLYLGGGLGGPRTRHCW